MRFDREVNRRRHNARQAQQKAKFAHCYPKVGSAVYTAVNSGNFLQAWSMRRVVWHACYLEAGGNSQKTAERKPVGMAVLDALGFDGNTDITELQDFLNRMRHESDFSIRIGQLRDFLTAPQG